MILRTILVISALSLSVGCMDTFSSNGGGGASAFPNLAITEPAGGFVPGATVRMSWSEAPVVAPAPTNGTTLSTLAAITDYLVEYSQDDKATWSAVLVATLIEPGVIELIAPSIPGKPLFFRIRSAQDSRTLAQTSAAVSLGTVPALTVNFASREATWKYETYQPATLSLKVCRVVAGEDCATDASFVAFAASIANAAPGVGATNSVTPAELPYFPGGKQIIKLVGTYNSEEVVYATSGELVSEAAQVLALNPSTGLYVGGPTVNAQWTYAATQPASFSLQYCLVSGTSCAVDANWVLISSAVNAAAADGAAKSATFTIPPAAAGDVRFRLSHAFVVPMLAVYAESATVTIAVGLPAPNVTGLSNDAVPTKSKTWNWAANIASEFRYFVGTSPTHVFSIEPWDNTMTANIPNGDGTYYLHVQARDTVGSQESTIVTVSAIIDNTAPVVTIGAASATPMYQSRTITYPVTISGANSINLQASNINFSGSSTDCVATITNGTTASPTVSLSACSASNGTMAFTIGGVASDVAGNISAVTAATPLLTVDNRRPVIALSAPSVSILREASAVTFTTTITNSTSVSLTSGKVLLRTSGGAAAPGCAATVTNGTTTTPSISVTGCTGNGDLKVSLDAGIATSSVNGYTSLAVVDTGTITIDNTAPTIAIGAPNQSTIDLYTTAVFPITVSGSSVVNLLAGHVTFSGTSAGCTATIANGTTASPTVTVSDCSATSGTVQFTIAPAATDSAGNSNVTTAASAALTLSPPARPVITLGTPSLAQLRQAAAVTYTVSVANSTSVALTSGKVLMKNSGGTAAAGCVATVTNGTTTTPGISITGCTGNDILTVELDSAVATNSNNGLTSLAVGSTGTVTIDNIAPVINIEAPSMAQAQVSQNFYFDITGGPANFTNAKYSLSGATTDCLYGVSYPGGAGTTPRVTVMSCSGDGALTISVNAGIVTDAAGNTSAAVGPSTAVMIDNTPPTVAITSVQTSPGRNSPITLNVDFSEVVTGFTLADLVATNGSVSNLQTISGSAYTVEFTPAAKGASTVSMAATKVTDLVLFPNSASNIFSYNYQPIPSNVLNLAAIASDQRVDFSWTAPTGGASGYQIAYNIGGVVPADCATAAVVIPPGSITGTSHSLTGLTNLAEIHARICATNSMVPADLSAGVTVSAIPNNYQLSDVVGSYTLSRERVTLIKGAGPQTVTVNFAQAASMNFDVNYRVYGNKQNLLSQVLKTTDNKILVTQGSTSVSFDVELASGVTITNDDFIKIALQEDAGPSGTLDLALYASVYPLNFDKVSTGNEHACGITSGYLYCWGSNSDGQVGIGSTAPVVNDPTQVGVSGQWSDVSAGEDFTCAIKASQLFCWGKNMNGRLGSVSGGVPVTSKNTPFQVGVLNAWTAIAAGATHACGVQNGGVKCWGDDAQEQLGNFTTSGDQPEPGAQMTAGPIGKLISGKNHSCILRSGELWCWGGNSFGQLGIVGGDRNFPWKVGVSTTWTDISSGLNSTCGINAGALYCWGTNDHGQVGNGTSGATVVDTPAQVGVLTNWQKVSVGLDSVCGVETGNLYCWGKNDERQLGFGGVAVADVLSPTQVSASGGWTAVAVNDAYVCGLESGQIRCWGKNKSHRAITPDSAFANVKLPQKVSPMSDWQAGNQGDDYSCALKKKKLWCWGNRFSSTAMKGSSAPKLTHPERDFDKISIYKDHGCGVDSGKLYCWGANSHGELGQNDLVASTAAVQVQASSTWQDVAVGTAFTCGIDANRLYCWGYDNFGQIGNAGTSSDQLLPVEVGSTATWQTVSVAMGRACAIKTTGQLYCWGRNNSGQGGVGYTSDLIVPTQVGAATDWQAIGIGESHSCGIRAGDLYCWGSPTYGRTGLSKTVGDDLTPARVGSASTWTKISANSNNTCGISNNSLFCWGNNTYGQIGSGTDGVASVYLPIPIAAGQQFQSVGIGLDHACAVKSGEIFCWGSNSGGQTAATLGSGNP